MLEGRLKLVIDGTELVLDEGDSIFFDSSAGHGMKALGGGQPASSRSFYRGERCCKNT